MSQADSQYSSSVAVLLRNRTGDTIHRQGCAALRPGAVRWRWADENPDEDWKTTAPWLHACQRCNPPSPAREKDLMEALRESLSRARTADATTGERRP